jgi:phytoene synthase
VKPSQIRRGRAIHRQTGNTFYYATRLLPARVRDEVYVLYGFFRLADEVVDGEAVDGPVAQRERLEELRAAALGEQPADDPVVAAFADLRVEAEIPDAEVDAFVDAMIADVDTDRYETAADVDGYVRGSAAAVGHMLSAVMDTDPEGPARPHAAALGEALQLTNFLRDVREDYRDLGRVYLPQATLRRHGVTDDDLAAEAASPALRAAVREELLRAEQRYREGVAGIEYLPPDCQFPVLLAATLYAEHHRLIRARDYDVLAQPPSLSTARKLAVVARTYWHWRRAADPVAAFRRASAVPERPAEADESGSEGVSAVVNAD